MAAERCAWVLSILLVLACSPEPDGSSSRRPPLHSVLLVTVDTLRADELGSYGRTGNPTPQMDALAARGIVFETAVAAATRTAPSHATLLTSRFPREHSIGHGNGTTRLEGITTLAERFGAEGYDTAAFVSSFILDRRIGLDRGFDVYDDELPRYEQNRPFYIERLARDTTERALRWLERPRRVPFFVWVHYQDPHGPYTPPSELVRRADRGGASDRRLPVLPGDRGRNGIPAYQRLEGLEWASEYTARYAGEIAYVDAAVGRLLSAAERAAAPRGLVILLTADHGESLGEDSFYFQHGHATTPDLALAPFVLAAPGLEPGRRREPVSHVDAMPTLLELAGFAPPADARGLSLVGYLIEGHPIPERPLFCDIGNELSLFSGGRRVHVWGALKLWGDWAAGRTSAAGEPPESLLVFESFERGDDEGWREVPLDVELREQIHAYLRLGLAEVPAPELQGTDAERLRALGYVIDEPDGR